MMADFSRKFAEKLQQCLAVGKGCEHCSFSLGLRASVLKQLVHCNVSSMVFVTAVCSLQVVSHQWRKTSQSSCVTRRNYSAWTPLFKTESSCGFSVLVGTLALPLVSLLRMRAFLPGTARLQMMNSAKRLHKWLLMMMTWMMLLLAKQIADLIRVLQFPPRGLHLGSCQTMTRTVVV